MTCLFGGSYCLSFIAIVATMACEWLVGVPIACAWYVRLRGSYAVGGLMMRQGASSMGPSGGLWRAGARSPGSVLPGSQPSCPWRRMIGLGTLV